MTPQGPKSVLRHVTVLMCGKPCIKVWTCGAPNGVVIAARNSVAPAAGPLRVTTRDSAF